MSKQSGEMPQLLSALLWKEKSNRIRCIIEDDPQEIFAVNSRGQTPLHLACRRDYDESTIRLIFDADPTALSKQDSEGLTPLAMLLSPQRVSDSLVLTFVNADPQQIAVQDGKGCTPLIPACSYCSEGVILSMIHACPGAVSIFTADGTTPHVNAVWTGKPATVLRALLGVNSEAVSMPYNQYPNLVHLACERSHFLLPVIVEVCPEAVSVRDANRSTAVLAAIHGGAGPLIIHRLVAANPEQVSITNNYGYSAIKHFFREFESYLWKSASRDSGSNSARFFPKQLSCSLRLEGSRLVLVQHLDEDIKNRLMTMDTLLQANARGSLDSFGDLNVLNEAIQCHLCPPLAIAALLVCQPELSLTQQLSRYMWLHTLLSIDSVDRTRLYACDRCGALDDSGIYGRINFSRHDFDCLCLECYSQMTNEIKRNYGHNKKGVDILHEISTDCLIERVLSLVPRSASCPDSQGRLPLMIAVDKEYAWDEGLKDIVIASPTALESRDPGTMLYPAVAAAVGTWRWKRSAGQPDAQPIRQRKSQQLTTVFSLLMGNPTVVKIGTKKETSDSAPDSASKC